MPGTREIITLSYRQACRFLLSCQGLYPPRQLSGKNDIINFIKRVGCIQFDPLNRTGRNADLVLQSRVKKYNPKILQELLYKDRLLLDGWDKNMSIYSINDWPHFYRHRQGRLDHYRKSERGKSVADIIPRVRAEIRRTGPLSSADLDFKQTVDWSWAPTKLSRAALEYMYHTGELIIYRKKNNRKIYDFASRHVPQSIYNRGDPHKTPADYHAWRISRRIGSVGLLWNRSSDAWLGTCKTPERNAAIKRLTGKGLLKKISITGIPFPFYLRKQDVPQLERIISTNPSSYRAAIIAPLDNMLWDRQMIKALFGFQYRWEVYKPASERKYGYYVLPVLYGDRFVARCEPVQDKKNKTLLLRNWWWEKDVKVTDKMRSSIQKCFREFTGFLGLSCINLDQNLKKKLSWINQG